MTDAEAQAVVALWAKQKDAPVLASVADVADALDTTPGEAARLLAQVRAENATMAQARSLHKRRRVWAAALAAALLGCVSAVDFAPNSPTLTVEGSQTGPMAAAQRSIGSGIDETRTELTLVYHPHSLLRLVLGPQWTAPTQDAFVVDGAGTAHTFFPTCGGGQEGIARGYFRRTGLLTYSMSYFYPGTKLTGGPAALHADMGADGYDAPLDVSLR